MSKSLQGKCSFFFWNRRRREAEEGLSSSPVMQNWLRSKDGRAARLRVENRQGHQAGRARLLGPDNSKVSHAIRHHPLPNDAAGAVPRVGR